MQTQKNHLSVASMFIRFMVPKAGIEPAHLSMVDFESTASTDFATSALKGMRKTLWIIPLPPVYATLFRRVCV